MSEQDYTAEQLNDDLRRHRGSVAYKEANKKIYDREWRIDHIYHIRNANGDRVLYKRNEAQLAFDRAETARNAIVKARQLGFSTHIDINILDICLFRKDTAAGIIDQNLKDARKKLEKIKFAYDELPISLKVSNLVEIKKANADEIKFRNNSEISVGTSLRGGTQKLLHVSEYGKISVDNPEAARNIKTGAFPSVHERGTIYVESTAHGRSGEFFNLVDNAQKLIASGQNKSHLDWSVHFYAWWRHPTYRERADARIISKELIEYFKELKLKHGINLTGEQMVWYAIRHQEYGPDDVRSEYPSTIEEAFFASVQGAYFKSEMLRARQQGRVGGMIPHDPSYRVHTAWDIGEDCTSIIFIQTDGVRHRAIDYWEAEGESLQAGAGVLDAKKAERGFIYDTHFGPHDLEHKDWGDAAKTRVEQAKALGIKFKVVPRVSNKADSIEAARRILNMMWIDQEHCSRLVDVLDNYCKRWNNSLGQFMPDPLHNWASHGSDALQQYAMGLSDDRPGAKTPDKPKSGSSWAA